MKTVEKQNAEIQELLKSISEKCNSFAKAFPNGSNWSGDLVWVVDELKNINHFLKPNKTGLFSPIETK